ncbi:MAG TPA: hypothetical protein VGY77_11395 [Gemmataceae bacterium]|nr:hypothetical protein [Gemmataceae bacterium]
MSFRMKRRGRGRRQLLTISQVLHWADDHYKRMNKWPNLHSGRIRESLDDTWRRVDSALRLGLRGLAGGTSLARLLAERRGARNQTNIPRLTVKKILAWADSYYHKKGVWPKEISGTIPDAPEDTWLAVDRALRVGVRGLKGNSSLAQLLFEQRKVRNIQALKRLNTRQILAWADAYRRRTGTWPTSKSGPIKGAPGETWSGVNAALRSGRRGFPGGYSLPRLLARARRVRNPKNPPRLSAEKILKWAKDYLRRKRVWPTRKSGPIAQAPGETWAMIDRALRLGNRGLPGNSSLFKLISRFRKKAGRSMKRP